MVLRGLYVTCEAPTWIPYLCTCVCMCAVGIVGVMLSGPALWLQCFLAVFQTWIPTGSILLMTASRHELWVQFLSVLQLSLVQGNASYYSVDRQGKDDPISGVLPFYHVGEMRFPHLQCWSTLTNCTSSRRCHVPRQESLKDTRSSHPDLHWPYQRKDTSWWNILVITVGVTLSLW